MIEPIAALAGLGLLFGLVLGVAGKRLKVETSPVVEKIIEALPGTNCGACGYPGCAGLAEAIAAGTAQPAACSGGAQVESQICEILGVEPQEAREPLVARILCQGSTEKAASLYRYEGIPSCDLAATHFLGSKKCAHGCFGLGTCVQSCPFSALCMGGDGLPEVDLERCTGCGVCVSACPQDIIVLERITQAVFVGCSNTGPARDSRSVCSVSCIKCRICEKGCPFGAVRVQESGSGSIARIDTELCTNCGWCADHCPTKAIGTVTVPRRAASGGCDSGTVPETGCASCGLCNG